MYVVYNPEVRTMCNEPHATQEEQYQQGGRASLMPEGG